MTIKEILTGTSIDRLDAEVLLSHILQCTRTNLLTRESEELSEEQSIKWAELESRRKNHEPVSYITGQKEFYGRDFLVTPAVLIPRPATEGLIDLAKDFLESPKDDTREIDTEIVAVSKMLATETPRWDVSTVIDVGTGSGCIAITLALEMPHLRVIATDISQDALDIASQNIEKYGVGDRVTLRLEEQFESISSQKDPFIVVSNPPYIPSGETLMKDVANFEPHIALFSGEKGGDAIRRIQKKCEGNLSCIGWVMEGRTHQF